MRESLAYLQRQLQHMDLARTADAIEDLRQVLYQILEHLDHALPIEVEPD